MKKLISLLLALALVCTAALPACAAGVSNFKKDKTYTQGQFSDVSADKWYAENVRSAYELGLMEGMSEDVFSPEGSLTAVQTIVMACRVHSIFNGINADFVNNGRAWYAPYTDYAHDHDIVTVDEEALNQPVDRATFSMILGSALPDAALAPISSIEDGSIPDVPHGSFCYNAVYRLYRAGVLTGNDSIGTFTPSSTITRGAAAAIISRMADPSLRKAITLVRGPFVPVPMDQLENRKSIQKGATDEELKQAYDIAVEIVTPLANLPLEEQLKGIADELRRRFDPSGYSTSAPHYNDPYGFLVLNTASCAGCARTTGLCLNILGISYEHVNENQWGHQWARVNVNGEYWICDAFALYCGPEPSPYGHPLA